MPKKEVVTGTRTVEPVGPPEGTAERYLSVVTDGHIVFCKYDNEPCSDKTQSVIVSKMLSLDSLQAHFIDGLIYDARTRAIEDAKITDLIQEAFNMGLRAQAAASGTKVVKAYELFEKIKEIRWFSRVPVPWD